MCGGTTDWPGWAWARAGLSPRVRGNRLNPQGAPLVAGSIPACAGEPKRPWSSTSAPWVYPRVCGGTSWCMMPSASRGGLSPRVRGNPARPRMSGRPKVSIPACAGEPRGRPAPPASPRVYPACAGEPALDLVCYAARTVYPRVCGGTSASATSARSRHRSIPACAGEPPTRDEPGGSSQVYPRVCGGTEMPGEHPYEEMGLSPRVRGNPFPTDRQALMPGLSPRVRGNLCRGG